MGKKKILVTGSAGVAGQYFGKTFSNYQLLLTTKNNLDVTKKEDVFATVEEFNPDIIIHLAAETDVDLCERDKKHALSVNYLGTKNIAEACLKVVATLVYVSTSAVFNGKKRYYVESGDQP